MPSWLTALIGVTGTLAGVLLTQLNANRQEGKRSEREQQREESRRADEAVAQTFEHRRDAYADFMQEWHSYFSRIVDWQITGEWDRMPEPPEDYLNPLWNKLLVVQMYGTSAAYEAADQAHTAMSEMCYGGRTLDEEPLTNLIVQIRADLRVPD